MQTSVSFSRQEKDVNFNFLTQDSLHIFILYAKLSLSNFDGIFSSVLSHKKCSSRTWRMCPHLVIHHPREELERRTKLSPSRGKVTAFYDTSSYLESAWGCIWSSRLKVRDILIVIHYERHNIKKRLKISKTDLTRRVLTAPLVVLFTSSSVKHDMISVEERLSKTWKHLLRSSFICKFWGEKWEDIQSQFVSWLTLSFNHHVSSWQLHRVFIFLKIVSFWDCFHLLSSSMVSFDWCHSRSREKELFPRVCFDFPKDFWVKQTEVSDLDLRSKIHSCP